LIVKLFVDNALVGFYNSLLSAIVHDLYHYLFLHLNIYKSYIVFHVILLLLQNNSFVILLEAIICYFIAVHLLRNNSFITLIEANICYFIAVDLLQNNPFITLLEANILFYCCTSATK